MKVRSFEGSENIQKKGVGQTVQFRIINSLQLTGNKSQIKHIAISSINEAVNLKTYLHVNQNLV